MVFEKLIVFRGENALWNLGDIKIGGGVHEFVYSECSNNAPVTDNKSKNPVKLYL